MDNLSKILFPNQPSWLRRKQLRTIYGVVLTSVVFASIVAALMFYAANKK